MIAEPSILFSVGSVKSEICFILCRLQRYALHFLGSMVSGRGPVHFLLSISSTPRKSSLCYYVSPVFAFFETIVSAHASGNLGTTAGIARGFPDRPDVVGPIWMFRRRLRSNTDQELKVRERSIPNGSYSN